MLKNFNQLYFDFITNFLIFLNTIWRPARELTKRTCNIVSNESLLKLSSHVSSNLLSNRLGLLGSQSSHIRNIFSPIFSRLAIIQIVLFSTVVFLNPIFTNNANAIITMEWDTSFNWSNPVSGTSQSAYYEVGSGDDTKMLKAIINYPLLDLEIGWFIEQKSDEGYFEIARNRKLAGRDSLQVKNGRFDVGPTKLCISSCKVLEFHPIDFDQIQSEQVEITISAYIVGVPWLYDLIKITIQRKSIEMDWQYSSFDGEIQAGVYNNPANNGYNWQYGVLKSRVAFEYIRLETVEEPFIGPVVKSAGPSSLSNSGSVDIGTSNRFGIWTLSRATEPCGFEYCYRFIFKPSRYQLNHLRRDVKMHFDAYYRHFYGAVDHARITINLKARQHVIPEISIDVHQESKSQTREGDNAKVKFVATASINATQNLEIGVEVSETGNFLPALALRPNTVIITSGYKVGILDVSIVNDTIDEVDGMVTVKLLADRSTTNAYQLAINPEYHSAVALVVDDDTPSISIKVHSDTPIPVYEAPNTVVNFELGTDIPNLEDIAVQVRLTSIGNYLAGGRNEQMDSITILAGQSLGVLAVPIHHNGAAGFNGAIRIEIIPDTAVPPTYTLDASHDQIRASAVVFNFDPDREPSSNLQSTPVIAIAPHRDSNQSVNEAESFSAKFVVYSHIEVENDLVVNLRITESTDYLPDHLTEQTVIATGATSSTIEIPLVNNNLDELAGEIMVSIVPDSNVPALYQITDFQHLQVATVSVIDDERPEISIRPHPDSFSSIVESPIAVAKFIISSDLQPAQELTIGLEISESEDFIPIPNNSKLAIMLKPNQVEESFHLEIKNDDLSEEDGTATVRLTEVADGTTAYKLTENVELLSATVNIVDDDDNRILIQAMSEVINEGETAEFKITSNFNRTEAIDLQIRVSQVGEFLDDTTEIRDVTLGIGTPEVQLPLNLATLHDQVTENNGRITAEILTTQLNDSNNFEIEPNSASIAVLDLDGGSVPVISIATEQNWIISGEMVELSFIATPVPSQDLQVPVSIVQSELGLVRWRMHRTVTISNGTGSLQIQTNQFGGSNETIDIVVNESDQYDIVNNRVRIEIFGLNYTANEAESQIAMSNVVVNSIMNHMQQSIEPNVAEKPVITIVSLIDYVEEGEPAKIKITTQSSVLEDLRVALAISNEVNEHENNFETSVIISAGENEVLFELVTPNDFVFEESYTVVVSIVASDQYEIELPGNTKYTLTDENDQVAAEFNRVNRIVLPGLVRTSVSESINTISAHMDLSLVGDLESNFELGDQDSLMGLVTASGNAINDDNLTLKSVFGDTAFVMKPSLDFGRISELSIWGLSNYQENSPIRINSLQDVEGDIFSGEIGADLKFDFGGLIGLGISKSETGTKYRGLEINHIDYTTESNMISSYLGWMSPDQAATLKVISGYGDGTVEVQHPNLGSMLFDSSFQVTVLSGELRLASIESKSNLGEFEWRLNGAIGTLQSSFVNHSDLVEDVETKTLNSRLYSELNYTSMLDRGASFHSQLLVGSFHSQKPNSMNAGSEIGYGFSYHEPIGLKLSVQGQIPLAKYEDFFQHAGIGGEFRFDSNEDKMGIQLTGSAMVGSTHGDSMLDFASQEFWSPTTESTNQNSAGEIAGEIGYGFDLWNGLGVITPYSGVNHSVDSYNQYYFGTQVEFNSGSIFELKGTQKINDSGLFKPNVQLNGKFSW